MTTQSVLPAALATLALLLPVGPVSAAESPEPVVDVSLTDAEYEAIVEAEARCPGVYIEGSCAVVTVAPARAEYRQRLRPPVRCPARMYRSETRREWLSSWAARSMKRARAIRCWRWR